MVFLRLITLLPLFMLLHVTHGAMSKVLAADETGQPAVPRRIPVNGVKQIYDGVSAALDEVECTGIWGRKMSMPKRISGMIKEEGFNNIDGERRFITSTSNGGRRRRHVKVKIAGFIPLNADYHVPKPHPPKNN